MQVLITGANRGIGRELALRLAARGDHVLAACRNAPPDLKAPNLKVIEGVDVTDADSVSSLARRLGGARLDILVNNAGVLDHEDLGHLDFDAIERQFRVNALGPLRVTEALLGNLRSGSRVFIITSRMGSIDDNTSGGYYGYRMSKAAVNMAGRSLAVDLRDHGIGVFLLHPGSVATDMTGNQGLTTVEESVNYLVERMDALGIEESGSFWHAQGERLPW